MGEAMRWKWAALASALLVAAALAPPAASSAARAQDGPSTTVWVNSTVLITTNFGLIKAMLYDEGAPITVGNFLDLATSQFYDGIKFHRIVDDFVIQTGDPNTKDSNPYNDGMGGSSQTIPLEINEELTHIDGALGMARSNDPNSASSQFYICDGAQHGLDGNYAVFGVVVEGIEVVRQIASQPVWGLKRPAIQQQPIDDIIMESVVADLGYNETVRAPGPGGGGGGLLGDFGSFAGGSGEVAVSLLAVVVVATVGAFSVPSLRRQAWRIVGSYGADVRRMRGGRRAARDVGRITGVLRSGARRFAAVARRSIARGR
jgi:peptidyl-prolyl cis-trans isomerase B (cyclophilin B)